MADLERKLKASLADARRGSADASQQHYLNLSRCMETEEEEQFDVDLTILDFLVYKATGLIFEWTAANDRYNSDLPNALVNMTADWRTVLKNRHHGRRLEPKAAFRSRLLQFALVHTHRLHHTETWTTEESLNELREQNKSRGAYWKERTQHPPAIQQPFNELKEFPLSDGALYQNRNNLASALDIPPNKRRWVTDVSGTASLHCLLPLFVELTAARVDMGDGWHPTSDWFDLAGEFMLQAVIEEFLRDGVYDVESFNTVFAFGCPGVERWAEEPSNVTAMRLLFCDDNNLRKENQTWTTIKNKYINELLPRQQSRSFWEAMKAAQRQHPYLDFEERLISFLRYLHEGIDKPDLIQVEEGRISIDGSELSDADSRDMIRRMGL